MSSDTNKTANGPTINETGPENARNADNDSAGDAAVIEAFENGLEDGGAFRARWEETLQRAQDRRQARETEQKEEENRRKDAERQARESEQAAGGGEDARPLDLSALEPGARPAGWETVEPGAQANSAETAQTPEGEAPAAAAPAAEADAPADAAQDAADETAPSAAPEAAAAPKRRRGSTLGGIIPPTEVVDVYALTGQDGAHVKKGAGEKLSFRLRTRFSKAGFARFMHSNFPARGDSGGEIVRKLIMDVSFVVLIAALVYLGIYYKNYRTRIRQTEDWRTQIEDLQDLSPEKLDLVWNNIHASYPDVQFPDGMDVKFAHLYAISSDTVGWLNIPNTNISTVLLQTDNDSYYLYRDIYKDTSRYGNPYVKYDCKMTREGLSKNTIIYGHNTHDGLMFHQLERYMKVDGYLNAPIISLDTLYETTKWKIFAVMLTNADSTDDNGRVFNYLYPEFASESAFLSKMREVQQRSMIHTGVDVAATDKVLTLYTCFRSYFNSGRLIVMARQLRPGESESIDPTQVYYDSTAIFPQAYYDYFKIPNPNAGAVIASNAGPAPAAETAAPETAAPQTSAAPDELVAVTEAAAAAADREDPSAQ